MLDTKQLAGRVLISQGKPKGWLASLSPADIETLAAMADAGGNATPETPARFAAWLDEYYESKKASVDDDSPPDETE